jgi:hypothetical protein
MLGPLFGMLLSGQVAPVTPADVRAITAIVVEDVAPAAGKLGQRATTERPLILDYKQVTRAFQAVGGPDTADPPQLGRPFSVHAHDDVVTCSEPKIHRDCQVANDGIFVAITEVSLDNATGQIRVRASVTWTHELPGAVHHLEGYTVDIFVGRDVSGWKILRHGTYLVS